VKLETAPQEWTIAEPVRAVFPTRSLAVGCTTYVDRIPSWTRTVTTEAKLGFVPPFAVTSVTTRGASTARVLASEDFAESAAILDLASLPNLGSETSAVRRAGGEAGVALTRAGWLVNAALVEGRGRLVPPYRQLARAAALDEGRRSDWERRLLAASRWFSRGYRSARGPPIGSRARWSRWIACSSSPPTASESLTRDTCVLSQGCRSG
jgi:hypothetical protein